MLQRLRHYFALGDLQLKLYILATLTGILAGAVIIVFRLLIEQSQVGLLPSGQLDDFASLSWYWILLMPILGGLLVGLLFNGLDAKQRSIVLYT
jgi:H+/Cl- antiporter ClcA